MQYQFFHSLGLLAIGVLQRDLRYDTPALRAAIRLLLLGMLLFAGSIYAMTFGAPRWLGMVAPFGGVSLMSAWLVFAWSVARAAPAARAPAGAADAAGNAPLSEPDGPRRLTGRVAARALSRRALKVSQAFTSPLSKPRLNQLMRCCALPWVKDSGTT